MPEPQQVVAPGTKIEAAWGNRTTTRAASRYADAAARDAATPSPETGELAFTEDDKRLLIYDGANWKPVMPGSRRFFVSGGGTVTTLTTWQTIDSGSFNAPGAPTLPGVKVSTQIMAFGHTDCSPQNSNLVRTRLRLSYDNGVSWTVGGECRNTHASGLRYLPTHAAVGIIDTLVNPDPIRWEAQAHQSAGSPGDCTWSHMRYVIVSEAEGWL